MNIHQMIGQAFEDQWELLDVSDTFEVERRDAFDTIDDDPTEFMAQHTAAIMAAFNTTRCERCEDGAGVDRQIEVIGSTGFHFEQATLCTDCYIEHQGSLR